MDPQFLINCGFGLAGILAGWLFHILWGLIKELREEAKALQQEISSVKVLVAGDYVKRDAFEGFCKEVFAKLDDIRNRMDSKADR